MTLGAATGRPTQQNAPPCHFDDASHDWEIAASVTMDWPYSHGGGAAIQADRPRFKDTYSFEARCKEAAAVLARMPDRVPVIVERVIRSTTVPLLDKTKYMVPADLTVGQFIHVIRRRLVLPAETAVFVFFGRELPTTGTTMREMYARSRDDDGFLYATYCGENTFGHGAHADASDALSRQEPATTATAIATEHETAVPAVTAISRRRQARCRSSVIGTARSLQCSICGRTCHADTVEVDHVIPRSVSGDDSLENLWALCLDCHCVKTRTERAMLMYALQGHERQCWVCGHRVSRFFCSGLWCADCTRRHRNREMALLAAKKRVRHAVLTRLQRLRAECL
jgi:GABA(A) receptor-associated protein